MIEPIAVALATDDDSIAEEVHAALGPEGGLRQVISAEAQLDAEVLRELSLLIISMRGDAQLSAAYAGSIAAALPELLLVVVRNEPPTPAETELFRHAGVLATVSRGTSWQREIQQVLDFTRRFARLQRERATLIADLAQETKLSALGLLAAGVSHEINNPAAVITANLATARDQLQRVGAEPLFRRAQALDHVFEDIMSSIADCLSSVDRIRSIVNALTAFSRKPDDRAVVIDVNREVQTVLRLMGKELLYAARIELSLDERLPTILAPVNTIAQIVTNLVVNALQAFETHHVASPCIQIATQFDDDHILLEVSDNGPGVAVEHQRRIFDPFFTTKDIGKGTGLGLAISREVVQKIGGDIILASVPGEGARFSVVVPRQSQLTATREQPRAPTVAQRLRVLVIDDDALILRALGRSLKPFFDCTAYPSAADALSALERDPDIDVIVCDVLMPSQNGLEFFEKLASRWPMLSGHVLFLSGGIGTGMKDRIEATGRRWLHKPIDVEDLVRAIREVAMS